MDTPRSQLRLEKKSRATSCTSCRQVKLKCDLKEKFPNPCSRCATNHHECKTDASFKRVPARSRIRDLESQIDQLKRDRALSQATSSAYSAEQTPEIERRSSSNSRVNDHLAVYATSEGPSYGSPTNSDVSRTDARWLNLTDIDEPIHFALEGIPLSYSHALEIFNHFEEHYYPHFSILEPVVSLKQLHADSCFLFWAIILVASQNHQEHASLAESFRPCLDRLQTTVITEAVPSLPNLQALLLLCSFPFHKDCPLYRDASWTLLGLATNAARQLGLDKSKDEMLFGSRKAPDSLNRYPRHLRQMTWMKCFELDVQMSCWHGHVPSLASAQSIRTLASLCEGVPSSTFAALVNVDIELAQALAYFEDNFGASSQSPNHMLQTFIDRLNAVKTRRSSTWTLNAELELLTAKLYIYGACIVGSEAASERDDSLYLDTLRGSLSTAVQLTSLVTNLSAEALANYSSYGFMQNHDPLPAHPKHHTRIAFFAAIVLLKCLDDDPAMSDEDKETARNAFGRVYQMYSSCSTIPGSESANAARTLQTIGRAIGQGGGNLKPHVTTRMGASLLHNAVWLASQIQAGEMDPGETTTGTSTILDGSFLIPPNSQPYIAPNQSYNTTYATTSAPFEDVNLDGPVWDLGAVSMPNVELPFGVWDNSVYENWQTCWPSPPVTH